MKIGIKLIVIISFSIISLLSCKPNNENLPETKTVVVDNNGEARIDTSQNNGIDIEFELNDKVKEIGNKIVYETDGFSYVRIYIYDINNNIIIYSEENYNDFFSLDGTKATRSLLSIANDIIGLVIDIKIFKTEEYIKVIYTSANLNLSLIDLLFDLPRFDKIEKIPFPFCYLGTYNIKHFQTALNAASYVLLFIPEVTVTKITAVVIDVVSLSLDTFDYFGIIDKEKEYDLVGIVGTKVVMPIPHEYLKSILDKIYITPDPIPVPDPIPTPEPEPEPEPEPGIMPPENVSFIDFDIQLENYYVYVEKVNNNNDQFWIEKMDIDRMSGDVFELEVWFGCSIYSEIDKIDIDEDDHDIRLVDDDDSSDEIIDPGERSDKYEFEIEVQDSGTAYIYFDAYFDNMDKSNNFSEVKFRIKD